MVRILTPLFMGGMPIFLYMGNTPYFDPGLYNVIHELINHWLVDHWEVQYQFRGRLSLVWVFLQQPPLLNFTEWY